MWFLSAPKSRRTPTWRESRGKFRPRLEALEDRCLLSAGALDPTFGNGGLVSGPNIGQLGDSGAFAVVVQTNGQIVAGGGNYNASRGTDMALERFNANGTLDSSFGTGGVVQTLAGAGESNILALALQNNGDIVAVGYAFHSSSVEELAVVRYNSNGSLDTSFGSRGIVQIWTSNENYCATAVAIQADGKIDVAGEGFGLAQFNTNGSLDTTFGSRQNPGIVATPAYGGPNGLAVQSNGEILVAGSTGSAMGVARYTTTGQLDSSFGSRGIVTMAPAGSTASYARSVVVQSSGDIVAAGYSVVGTADVLTLARLTSTGILDTTFGGSNTGFAIDSSATVDEDIGQAANGDLVAGCRPDRGVTQDFEIAAYLPSGVPDTTFGTGGNANADFAGGFVNNYAMTIQGDGKIVAVGTGNNGSATIFALARFLPPNTKIGSFTGSSTGGNVTLTASDAMNSNPSTTISQVNFYLQGSLTPLGTGTNNNGTWTFTFAESAAGLVPGDTCTFVAQAVDGAGVLSDPVTLTLTVN